MNLVIIWELGFEIWSFRAMRGDGVPFVEWTNELAMCRKLKFHKDEGIGKPSLNKAFSGTY